MIRRLVLLALVVAALAAWPGTARAAGYDDGTVRFAFQDDEITESSGVVASSVDDGIWFTHNDSGDSARYFAVDDHGCSLEVHDLPGVDAVDIEDIARGPHDGGTSLWLADIGDNLHERSEIAVHEVAQPTVNESGGRETDACPMRRTVTDEPTTYRLAYPDTAHDAETLLADPLDGRLYVVTKSPNLTSLVYAAPLPLVEDRVNVLELVGAIVFPPSATYDRDPATEVGALAGGSTQIGFDLTGRLWAVGGDVAPDRSRVVVRTYTDAFEWVIPEGAALADAFRSVPLQVALDYERQGEAIAYSRDGSSLLTTCEDAGCPATYYAGSTT